MKVIIIKTRQSQEVNESYGARLIEQGKAVLAPAPAAKAVKEPEAAKKEKDR